MVRISKAPEVRRREIVDAALELFATKGYAAATVNDILNAVGIAKGTFYHHFTSKEEVMRAVVQQIVDQGIERAEAIADDQSIPPPDRILAILASQQLEEDTASMVTALHEAGNVEFHLLSNIGMVTHLSPIIARVVREGIDEGVFDVAHPEEAVSILLTAAFFLTDEGFEGYTPDLDRLMPALLIAAERLFGAAQGTFLDRAAQLEGS
ncbi:MAG: TetR/AcrR family transcriptional regulator [Acidimicrobiia bacterium]|nr:TetR/AcrR family transcriptional regulator [Acidimicrobiia bacterium]